MTFLDLSAGADVFVDANVFLHHFGPDPQYGPPSTDLLLRIKRKEIAGFTSTHIVGEIAHRMMTIEAMKRLGWKSAGIAQRLRQNPTEVKQLVAFRQAIQDVPQFGIRILTIDPTQLDAAAAISQQTGLLSNDALLVAVMQTHGLTNLASADPDFDRVPALTRYAPA